MKDARTGGDVVARLRADTGDFYIKGTAQYVANLDHNNGTSEFVVKSVVTCSLIDLNGNLKYRRWLIQ